LVLSEGAGSYAELGEFAIDISDPLDVSATAEALGAAIDLPAAERASRAKRLTSIVRSSKPGDWIEAQIDDLAAIGRGEPPLSDPISVL
jgi:trehalose 6-phosphate synthase